MAVAQGYGKTVTSGSVFAYDVADTRNSYRGEPTTNLANFNVATSGFNSDTPGNLTQTSNSSEVTYQGRLSRKMVVGAGFWNAYIYSYNTGISNTVFAISYKVKTADGTHPNTIITGAYIYGSAGSFLPAPTFTYLNDGWYLASMLYNGTSMTLNNLTGMYGNGGPKTFYIVDYQAEAKSHATPFTPAGTTRSVTQGLLPLVGNLSIDLSNVSFDSNAQISLDGSSDYVKISQNNNFFTNEWAWEMVVKFTANTGTYQGLVWAEGDTGGGSGLQYLLTLYNHTYFHYRITNATTGWTNTDTSTISFTPSNYNHIVWQFNNGVVNIYINGTLFHTDSSRGAYNGGTNSPVFVGARNDGAYSSAIQPSVIKQYNRTLSAGEVRQNYLHYKTRFNLS
jgi:hypothetical protein